MVSTSAFSQEKIKDSLRFTWKKAFLLIAFFLLFALCNLFLTANVFFIIFAWPFYLLPRKPFFASLLELLYAYAVATIVLFLLERPQKK
jgi:hypothetical protein